MHLIFEYDPDKNKENQQRHGIDFEQAQQLWKVPHGFYRARTVFGEDRYIILGKLDDRVYIAIFAYRESVIRLISCHRADLRWQKEYERMSHEA